MSKIITLITGITGQDGSILARKLLEEGHEVHGLVRRSSSPNLERLEGVEQYLELHYGDVTDHHSVASIMQSIKPEYVYNFAGQSDPFLSTQIPLYTTLVNTIGALSIMEEARKYGCKIYQASTCEIYGEAFGFAQNESTTLDPVSPYGVAKTAAHLAARNLRWNHGVFICAGISYNHESPIRGSNFVTRKITKAFTKIQRGQQNSVLLGNLNSRRDWSHAEDVVNAIQLITECDRADEYVIASGVEHSVRQFAEEAAKYFDWTIRWEHGSDNEVGVRESDGKILIQVEPELFRPGDFESSVGDAGKLKHELGWKPNYTFETLVLTMMEADYWRY